MTWDFAYSMPFAAFIGGATLVGIFFAKDRKAIPWSRELVLIVVLLAYFTFTTLFSWAPQNAWPQLEKVFKIILMTVLSTMFIYGRNRITVMMFTIALSLGFYGVKGAIFVVTTGGAGQVKGPEGSFLDGNTFVGVAMITFRSTPNSSRPGSCSKAAEKNISPERKRTVNSGDSKCIQYCFCPSLFR